MLSPYKSSFRCTSPQMPMRTVAGVTAPHKGIDLVGIDKNIYSVSNGIVVISTYTLIGASRDFGNRVWIRDTDNKIVCYNHLSQRKALVGQKIKIGDLIGIEGATGRTTGSHLHFEVRDRLGIEFKNFSAADYIGIPNQVGVYNVITAPPVITPPVSISPIKEGDKVKVTTAITNGHRRYGRTYTGGLWRMYYTVYDVISVNGDRVVIGINKAITATVKITDLKKI